jgi:hypothetical protein
MLIIIYALAWTRVPNYIDLCGVNFFGFLEPSLSLFGRATNCPKKLGNFREKENLSEIWLVFAKENNNFLLSQFCL